MLASQSLTMPLQLSLPFMGYPVASALASQEGYLTYRSEASLFVPNLEKNAPLIEKPATPRLSLSPASLREQPLSMEELASYAEDCLCQWKRNPTEPLDYAGFLLELERATRADFDCADIHKCWGEALDAICGILEKPANLFEACFPGAVNDASFRRRVSNATSLIKGRYFLSHRDGRPHMSGFLKNGIGNCSARMKFLISAFAPVFSRWLPPERQLAIEVFSKHVEAVIYDAEDGEMTELLGEFPTRNIKASLYHPALIFHAFLKERGLTSPVTERELLIRRGSEELSAEGMLQSLELGERSDEPLALPSSSVNSGDVSPPSAMQELSNWFARLPGVSYLRRAWFTPSGRRAVIAGIAMASSIESYHYVYLQNLFYESQSMEECCADPPRDSTPTHHERNLRYLGFSYDRGAGVFPFHDKRLCFEDPADAVEMGAQLSFSGRREIVEPHLTRFLGTAEFASYLSFLDDPMRAVTTFPEEELVRRLEGMRDYERILRGMGTAAFSGYFGSHESAFLQSFIQSDPRGRAYFDHIAELRMWAELNPRDVIALVNTAPLQARAVLMEMLMNETQQRAFHFSVRASQDKASAVVNPPPKHTRPVRYIEIDVSELVPVKEAEEVDGEGMASSLVARADSPAHSPEDDAELHVKPATVALLLQFVSPKSDEAFAKLARDGVWNAAVSEVFHRMDQRDAAFYSMLGGYISYVEVIPEHFKTFLEEGVSRGFIGYDQELGYHALDHFYRDKVEGEEEESWLTRILSAQTSIRR